MVQILLFRSGASWEVEAVVRRRLERNLLAGTMLYMPGEERDSIAVVSQRSYLRRIVLSETSIAFIAVYLKS